MQVGDPYPPPIQSKPRTSATPSRGGRLTWRNTGKPHVPLDQTSRITSTACRQVDRSGQRQRAERRAPQRRDPSSQRVRRCAASPSARGVQPAAGPSPRASSGRTSRPTAAVPSATSRSPRPSRRRPSPSPRPRRPPVPGSQPACRHRPRQEVVEPVELPSAAAQSRDPRPR